MAPTVLLEAAESMREAAWQLLQCVSRMDPNEITDDDMNRLTKALSRGDLNALGSDDEALADAIAADVRRRMDAPEVVVMETPGQSLDDERYTAIARSNSRLVGAAVASDRLGAAIALWFVAEANGWRAP